MLSFKKVVFALISSLTLYIGNVQNLPLKMGGRPTPDTPPPPFLRPCTGGGCRVSWIGERTSRGTRNRLIVSMGTSRHRARADHARPRAGDRAASLYTKSYLMYHCPPAVAPRAHQSHLNSLSIRETLTNMCRPGWRKSG